MIWEELFLSRIITAQEATSAIQLIFEAGESDILLSDIRDGKKLEIIPKIVFELLEYSGDFPFRLSIYIDDDLSTKMPRLDAIRELCNFLGCDACLGDDTINPYSYILVESNGTVKHISLDPDLLEEGVISIFRNK